MSTERLDSPRPSPSSPLGARDQLRRDWYLFRVDFFLDTAALVSRRERKRILASLRADIDAEAMQHGLDATLRGLGTPRVLALGYSDGQTASRPRWSGGIVASGVALLLYWIVFFSYTLGMLAVVNQYNLGEARSQFLFIDVIAFSHQDGIGVGWTSTWAWLIVPIILVGIVFLVSSRAWRAFGRKTRRLATTP